MSNRDRLRKLSKEFPAPAEVQEIIDALYDEHDRTVAIVGASLLESVLEKLFIRKMKVSTPEMLNQLFDNRGPLSDFHSKICVGIALGFLPKNMRDDLDRIKRIRNVFAHSRKRVTFDTPEIANEIEGSGILGAIRSVPIPHAPPDLYRTKHKRLFVMIVQIIFTIIDIDQQGLGGAPLKLYNQLNTEMEKAEAKDKGQ